MKDILFKIITLQIKKLQYIQNFEIMQYRRKTPQSQVSFLQKYSKLITDDQSQEQLREILKQLNKEIDDRIQNRKVKTSPNPRQDNQGEILQREKQNNIDIIKRLKYELAMTNKRVELLDEQNYVTQLEQQIAKAQENIKQLRINIANNNKINERLGKQIVENEEQDGIQLLQNEIRQLDREFNEYKSKNEQLKTRYEKINGKIAQMSDYRSQQVTKIKEKEQQAHIPVKQQQEVIDHYNKLIEQIQINKRTQRIIEEKYQVDFKMIQQEIKLKLIKKTEIAYQIDKLQVEISNINKRSTSFSHSKKEASFYGNYETPKNTKYRKSRYISHHNEININEFLDDQQELIKSHTVPKQLDQSNNSSDIHFNEQVSEVEIIQTKYNTIVEDQNEISKDQTLTNQQLQNQKENNDDI
ncbi:hypothetical protein pb186bvf_011066 [Paramecium bursaria]